MASHRRMLEEDTYQEEPRGGIKDWFKSWFGADDVDGEREHVDHDQSLSGARKHHPSPGLFPLTASHRQLRVSVRLNALSMDDAQDAVNSLKERCQVILNLEQASDGMDRRILDFVSGACYALDGCYQRVGSKVFLFAPSNVLIDVEDERTVQSVRQPSFLAQS